MLLEHCVTCSHNYNNWFVYTHAHIHTGIAAGSGLGATTLLCQLLKSGDHVIAMDDCYGGMNTRVTTTVHPE